MRTLSRGQGTPAVSSVKSRDLRGAAGERAKRAENSRSSGPFCIRPTPAIMPKRVARPRTNHERRRRQTARPGSHDRRLDIRQAFEMDWKPTRFEKVSIKVLYEDPERGEMTCLLKLEPGAHIPFHKHPEIEQTLVLEGSVEDHDGVATAGDYIWRKPGSLHDNTSPRGAVLFAVYRKPNLYYHAMKETAGF
jgi:anti-sigma factor ChrR (cupin superfamily)